MKIFIWVLLLAPHCLFAQESRTGHISVSMSGSTQKDFLIDIIKESSRIKIVYTVCDSTSDSFMEIYEAKSIQRDKIKDKDSINMLRNEMDSLWKANSFYRSESLEISMSSNLEYSDLLKRMFAAEKCDFANQTPNVLTADGFYVSLIIKSDDRYLKTGARSPTRTSYPLITKFLTETLRMGFNSACYSFLINEVTYIRP